MEIRERELGNEKWGISRQVGTKKPYSSSPTLIPDIFIKFPGTYSKPEKIYKFKL